MDLTSFTLHASPAGDALTADGNESKAPKTATLPLSFLSIGYFWTASQSCLAELVPTLLEKVQGSRELLRTALMGRCHLKHPLCQRDNGHSKNILCSTTVLLD